MSLADGAEICGVSEADIVKAAEWIAKPKDDGSRRKCVTAYEKGIIWGNDNYRTIGALVNIALATGNVGREGGGVCRLGGHQEGYMRPSDAHVGRPAPYIDQLLIAGKRQGPSHLGQRSLQDDAQRQRLQAGIQSPHQHGEGSHGCPCRRHPRRTGRRHRRRRSRRAACSRSTSTSSTARSARPPM